MLSHHNQLAVNRLTYVPELKKYYTVANQRLEQQKFVSHQDNVTVSWVVCCAVCVVKWCAPFDSSLCVEYITYVHAFTKYYTVANQRLEQQKFECQ